MTKQKFLIKLGLIVVILSTCFIGLVFSRYDQTNVSSGNCSSQHDSRNGGIIISTNYTDDEITIQQGETFDIEIEAQGQETGSVWIGYAFWHTASDSIAVPNPSPFNSPDNTVNEWNDGDDYYALFSWQSVTDPMTRIFRITPTNSPTIETLTIQVAGDNYHCSSALDFEIRVVGPDNYAPSVTITAPSNNSFVGGSSVSITATADDGLGSGVDTVWAEITNATYSETVLLSGTEPNYSGTWDSTVVVDGIYDLSVMANDSLGQLNDTESIKIKVDNNAPGISLHSIVPNPSNGLTMISVLNTTLDFDGNGVRATVDRPTAGDLYLDLVYQGSNNWSTTFTVTETGSHSVTINATDLASNTATIGPVAVTGDVTLPNVVITSPTHDQKVGGIVSISGTATGTGSNIASIYINNTIWGDGTQAPQTDTATGSLSGFFSFDNKTIIPVGLYWVEVNITDSAGNFNSSVRYFNMTSDDLSPPSLTITATPDPSNGFTNITVTSNENLLDIPLLNITTPTSEVIYRPLFLIGPNIWRTNYTVNDHGSHKIEVNATDTSFNIGKESINFTGDIIKPTISLSVFPNPSNGLTCISVYNTTEVVTSVLANISTPSGFIYRTLVYQGSNNWSATFIVIDNGIHVININATDLAGNIEYKSTPIIGDVVGPSIAFVDITPNPSNGLTVITASNSTNDLNAYGIRANITSPSMDTFHINLIYQGLSQWECNFTVLEDGNYTIWINATDVLGDTSYVMSTIIGDFTNPKITVNSPEKGDTGTDAPEFDITIVDLTIDKTWYKIFDGSKWSSLKYFVGLSGTIDEALWSTLENGELVIRFFANDSLGNMGYADVSFLKGKAAEAADASEPIRISEDQLTTISAIMGLLAVGGILIVLTLNEKKKRIRLNNW